MEPFARSLCVHCADRRKGAPDSANIEEPMQAANAIDNDRFQQAATGRIVPDTFIRGSSAQRMGWFMKSYRS